ALVVDSAYIALAWSQGEVKQFDAGIWTLFATGTLATRAGIEPVLRLYQRYSPTLLFVTLGLTALIPLLPRREPFTYYYARQHPVPGERQRAGRLLPRHRAREMPELRGRRARGRPDRVHAGHGVAQDRARRARRRARAARRALPRRGGLRAARQDSRVVSGAA